VNVKIKGQSHILFDNKGIIYYEFAPPKQKTTKHFTLKFWNIYSRYFYKKLLLYKCTFPYNIFGKVVFVRKTNTSVGTSTVLE
jgi:hypothetical protein